MGDHLDRELALKVAGYFERYAPALPHLRNSPPGLHYHVIAYGGGYGTEPFERFDTEVEAESFAGDAEMARAYERMEADPVRAGTGIRSAGGRGWRHDCNDAAQIPEPAQHRRRSSPPPLETST